MVDDPSSENAFVVKLQIGNQGRIVIPAYCVGRGICMQAIDCWRDCRMTG